jgi:hypothetical protein
MTDLLDKIPCLYAAAPGSGLPSEGFLHTHDDCYRAALRARGGHIVTVESLARACAAVDSQPGSIDYTAFAAALLAALGDEA